MTEIMQLEEEIRYHNKLYWEKNQPEISDIEYDTLTRELTKLNPTNSLLTVIHSPISTKGLKVKHKVKMLSLNKVYTIPELLTWCAKVSRGPHEQFLIQIKYDGCSANFTNGVLATRGDGEIGENITDKLPLIEMGVRKRDVRGEIIFRKSVFEKYKTILKKRDGTPYSNARNACAGMLNKDDLPVKEAILELIPFGMETTKGSLTDLKVFDFDSYIKEVEELDYPADGLVIKLADLDYKESLGYTSHHSRGEIALKFANESATTQLLDVTWSMGKEVITPIGNVQPVEISGVIVSNVSLHNMKFIMDMGIRIGDTLTIERAGDVIPHVINVTPASTPQINITISICPECNGLVAYAEPNIYCVNPHCKGKKVNRLYDSITRIGIDRIGKPTIKNMVDILEVDNLIDIFQLTKESLLRLPKFG